MAGGELFDRIQSQKITERDASNIMRQIGTAVQVFITKLKPTSFSESFSFYTIVKLHIVIWNQKIYYTALKMQPQNWNWSILVLLRR